VTRRIAAVVLVAATACVLIGLYVGLYLTEQPGTATAQAAPGGSAQLYLATVPAAKLSDPHPTWVSYYHVNSEIKDWQHKTTYVVPAHTLIHVTIYQFDTATGLRNPFIAQAMGVTGGQVLINGKPIKTINPNLASHVFAIPNMGISVPLPGAPDGKGSNDCANAPCSSANSHETVTFSFRTGAPGVFRWQCFVPCAAGFIDGFGGPMQTVGYMDGFLKVV
jgi:hypothetical protein